MQDVTGRFILNAAAQLRKRAASLCIAELSEYKVCVQQSIANSTAGCVLSRPDCWWLQRSKKLNILTNTKESEAAESRPSSASYLIPAVPNDGHAACSSEPSSSQLPCGQCHSIPHSGMQAPAAQSRPEPGCAASLQLQSASCSQSKGGIQTHTVDQFNGGLLGRQSVLPREVMPADPPRTLHGSMIKQTASEPTTGSNGSPATGLPCLRVPAAPPAKTDSSTARPHTDRHQWLHLSTQQGSAPSWSQNGSQLTHKWDNHDGPSGSQGFAQAKLAFTPAFPFSKQPCAVMW